eukprot:TRINITY_DN5513_c0_g1_i1.p1 TRINITY_DN5513_c0_g1~~TRINITY_DN5513_c0_g1_i1.p1  ORF type:complete len:174 (+),score=41.44 TRINITY_DN5513_c0_g1_i1:52-573(+)
MSSFMRAQSVTNIKRKSGNNNNLKGDINNRMKENENSLSSIKVLLKTLKIEDEDIKEIINIILSKIPEEQEEKENKVIILEENQSKKNEEFIVRLIQDEKNYVQNLSLIVDEYLMPLNTGQIKVKQQIIFAIFSNINILHSVHTDLLNQLEKQVKTGKKTIAETFSDIVCFIL